MSESDLKVGEVSADTNGNEEKTVPAAEVIRYRKRAEAAQKELAETQHRLHEAEAQKSQFAQQLLQVQQEQSLKDKLLAAGAADMETVMLVVKARLSQQDAPDVGKVIEQVRRDKPYLFETLTTTAFSATRGTKDKVSVMAEKLKTAAAKAFRTAGRTELMEYMKARRAR